MSSLLIAVHSRATRSEPHLITLHDDVELHFATAANLEPEPLALESLDEGGTVQGHVLSEPLLGSDVALVQRLVSVYGGRRRSVGHAPVRSRPTRSAPFLPLPQLPFPQRAVGGELVLQLLETEAQQLGARPALGKNPESKCEPLSLNLWRKPPIAHEVPLPVVDQLLQRGLEKADLAFELHERLQSHLPRARCHSSAYRPLHGRPGYNAAMSTLYRRLPAVHRLLETPQLRAAVQRHGRPAVVGACRRVLGELRVAAASGGLGAEQLETECAALPSRVASALAEAWRHPYAEVVNATGVLLHTNLGRAPLPAPMPPQLAGYLALEYDLEEGRRGQRLAPLARRLCDTLGTESAVMVNNNAAALALLLRAHADGREVVVSRGQLIEIGGSFRLPDVMAAAGARLVEVGCTNRTHLDDYRNAIGGETAAVLVAHQSNFRVVGFTSEPPLGDLARLAHEHDLPLFVDQGSGALHDLARWGLPHEPTVGELLAAGADVVCFSGDKLLGGPQAGVLAGAARWVDQLARHPLFRALRPDKTTLVWMDRVLAAHHAGRLDEIPLYALLAVTADTLRRRSRRMVRALQRTGVPATAVTTESTLGGGTTPGATLAGWGVAVNGGPDLAAALRTGAPPVIGTAHNDTIVLDLRTVFAAQDRTLEAAVTAAYNATQSRQAAGR